MLSPELYGMILLVRIIVLRIDGRLCVGSLIVIRTGTPRVVALAGSESVYEQDDRAGNRDQTEEDRSPGLADVVQSSDGQRERGKHDADHNDPSEIGDPAEHTAQRGEQETPPELALGSSVAEVDVVDEEQSDRFTEADITVMRHVVGRLKAGYGLLLRLLIYGLLMYRLLILRLLILRLFILRLLIYRLLVLRLLIYGLRLLIYRLRLLIYGFLIDRCGLRLNDRLGFRNDRLVIRYDSIIILYQGSGFLIDRLGLLRSCGLDLRLCLFGFQFSAAVGAE